LREAFVGALALPAAGTGVSTGPGAKNRAASTLGREQARVLRADSVRAAGDDRLGSLELHGPSWAR
jgi:hypothetical protein